MTPGPSPEHFVGMPTVSIVFTGVVGIVSPTIAWVFAQISDAESTLKLVALVLGGIVVPAYTLVTLWKQNRLRDAEIRLREAEVRAKLDDKPSDNSGEPTAGEKR